MEDYLKSGRQAVRLFYFLLIGFAVANSLSRLFLDGDSFRLPTVEHLLLFILFFSFISRFFLGAYRVLSHDIDDDLASSNILVDAIGFTFQALAFYVYSLNYNTLFASHWMIGLVCGVDTIWLVVLWIFYRNREKTYKQWIIHNIIFVVVILLNHYKCHSVYLLFIVGMLAMLFDVWYNYSFYFFLKGRNSLRIFVAGPYSDNLSPEETGSNIETAENVGKELALKGHTPFIPHTMLQGWEKDDRFMVNDFKRIDNDWLEKCNALFFISESPGANEERDRAVQGGLQIFTNLADVPDVK